MNATKTSARPPAERIVLIGLIRSLSIYLVLAVHLGGARFSQGLDRPVPRLWNLFARNGGYGVSLFFVLSGFLITRILVGPQLNVSAISFRQFYARRAGRILPLLALTILLGIFFARGRLASSPSLIYCFELSKPLPPVLISLVTFSFNWLAVWYDRWIGGIGQHWSILWSISVEEQFYFLYPLALVWLGTLPKVIAGLFLVIVVGPCYRWWACHVNPQWYLLGLAGSFGAFDQIAIGCLLYFLSRRYAAGLRKNPVYGPVLISVGMATLLLAYTRTNIYSGSDRILGPSWIAAGLFFLLWGGLAFEMKNTFFWKILCLPGELSYGIYLLHSTVLYFFWGALKTGNPWWAFVLYILVNTLLAQVSYRYFEKPANAWIRNRLFRTSAPNISKAG